MGTIIPGRPGPGDGGVLRAGQDLVAVRGDQHGVLELGRAPAVLVTTVHPSGHMSKSIVPRVSIGSMVKVIPGSMITLTLGSSKCGTMSPEWKVVPIPWPVKSRTTP